MTQAEVLARRLAGKSGADGSWLPLWMHLRDTAEIMVRLVRERLPEGAKAAIGLDDAELARVAWVLGATHDLGKATVAFQGRIARALTAEARARIEAEATLRPPKAGKWHTSHALASEVILRELGCPESLAAIAGAHHGEPQKDNLDDDIADQLEIHPRDYAARGEEATWRGAWEALWARAREGAGAGPLPEVPVPAALLLAGLLTMADWIASNTAYFPLIPVEETGDASAYPGRAEAAWRKLDLPPPWESRWGAAPDAACFAERFGFAPNSLQRAAMEAAHAMEEPGLLVVEAPMGEGKTEAALAAAEILNGKFGSGGLFFGLPTQTTANAIFARLLGWAGKQSAETAHAVRLAHGLAMLNDQFQALLPGRAATEEDNPGTGVLAHPWFQGSKQALLADFAIGTVDQLLLAALKQRHLMLRHLGLAGKVVVVDECHAYDAYMSQYLECALAWLGRYRVPTLLLSATLPARRRDAFVRAYQEGGAADTPPETVPDDDAAYPVLTWTDGPAVRRRALPPSAAKRAVAHLTLRDDTLADALRERLAQGGCAGVIVNTVRRAQALARSLRAALPDCRVRLLHAQFVLPDREARETELLDNLGKGSTPAKRDRLVVVGTQVLEQSLDIDFDFLATDWCPMDLLLQRMGRLHRHPRERPTPLREPVCATLEGTETPFDAGSLAVYDRWLLWRARALLPATVTLPDAIPTLVRQAYAWEPDCLAPDAEALAAKNEHENRQKSLRDRADTHRIHDPGHRRFTTLDNWMASDALNSDAAARAAVRDGDPAIEVLLLARHRDGTLHFLPWLEPAGAAPLDPTRPPDPQTARAIARQRLRLPARFARDSKCAERVIRELERSTADAVAAWQEAPLLAGELFLILDLNDDGTLTAEPDGKPLAYSREEGFLFAREEEA